MSIKTRTLTQAEYDALESKSGNTIYITDQGNIIKGEKNAFDGPGSDNAADCVLASFSDPEKEFYASVADAAGIYESGQRFSLWSMMTDDKTAGFQLAARLGAKTLYCRAKADGVWGQSVLLADAGGRAPDASKLGGLPVSGNGLGPLWGSVPAVTASGGIDLGRWVDFHMKNNDEKDRDLRAHLYNGEGDYPEPTLQFEQFVGMSGAGFLPFDDCANVRAKNVIAKVLSGALKHFIQLSLNGETKTFDASANCDLGGIFAPQSCGEKGQILVSNGQGAPGWSAPPKEGKLLKAGDGFALDNGSTRPVLGISAVDVSYTESGICGATGNRSFAEGDAATASGHASHAEGAGSRATGIASHAEGESTRASGMMSHSEGSDSKASGMISHAEGLDTVASGGVSHAEGFETVASGDWSHAGGRATIAKYNQCAVGRYNVASDASDKTYDETKEAFIIGNGTDYEERSNAFAVYFNGNVDVYGDIEDKSQTLETANKKVFAAINELKTALGDTETSASSAAAAAASAANAKTSEVNAKGSETVAAQALSDLLAMIGVDIATLIGGKIPVSQLPPIAITTPFLCESELEMLALNAQIGDLAIRSDISNTYILAADDPTALANWVELKKPTNYADQAGHADTADEAGNAQKINNHRVVTMTEEQYADAVIDPDTIYLVG